MVRLQHTLLGGLLLAIWLEEGPVQADVSCSGKRAILGCYIFSRRSGTSVFLFVD
jgi:hypothetical protein